jgi:hypothetical protein
VGVGVTVGVGAADVGAADVGTGTEFGEVVVGVSVGVRVTVVVNVGTIVVGVVGVGVGRNVVGELVGALRAGSGGGGASLFSVVWNTAATIVAGTPTPSTKVARG